MELISRHHNNSLTRHFGIKKTRELLASKYVCLFLRHDIKAYIKGCDICLILKAVRHKLYNNLQSLLVSTHRWEDLLMDFVTGLSISINWKKNSYDSILVIVNWLTKMVYYKPVKITIDASSLAKIIINMVVWHHGLPDSIVTNRGSFFTLKFWSLLCYFFGIKHRLSTAF